MLCFLVRTTEDETRKSQHSFYCLQLLGIWGSILECLCHLSPLGSRTKVACLCRTYSYHHTLTMLINKKLKKLPYCTSYNLVTPPRRPRQPLHFVSILLLPLCWPGITPIDEHGQGDCGTSSSILMFFTKC